MLTNLPATNADLLYEMGDPFDNDVRPEVKSKQLQFQSIAIGCIPGSLNYELIAAQRAATLDEAIGQTMKRHDIPAGDPIAEILDIVATLSSTSTHFESHVREILDDHGKKLTERIAQTVRSAISHERQDADNALQQLEAATEQLDIACQSLVKLTDRAAIENGVRAIVAGVSTSDTHTEIVKLLGQIGKQSDADGSNLKAIIERLDTLKSPPIQIHVQEIPRMFYIFSAAIAATIVAAAGLTYKSVEGRVELANWLSSPDGQLAKQIVAANKGGLNAQCKASTRKLVDPVTINGTPRNKLCFVAIP